MRGKKTPQHPAILQAKRTIRINRVYVALWVVVLIVIVTAPFVAGVIFESLGVFACAAVAAILPLSLLVMFATDELPKHIYRIENSRQLIDEYWWEEYQREQQKLQQILKEEGLL